MTINNAVNKPPGKPPKKCSIMASPLNPRNTNENMDAPISMTKTKELNLTVLSETSLIF